VLHYKRNRRLARLYLDPCVWLTPVRVGVTLLDGGNPSSCRFRSLWGGSVGMCSCGNTQGLFVAGAKDTGYSKFCLRLIVVIQTVTSREYYLTGSE
jgi:hypothetical protein